MTYQTPAKKNPSYLQDPLFEESMLLFQAGSWTNGLDQLHQLQTRYPDESELITLYDEMTVRSQVDLLEREDNRKNTYRSILKISILVCVLAAVSVFGWWSVNKYAVYVQNQIETMRIAAEANAQELETYARFRDAQNLLLADRPGDALLKFHEIEKIKPDYPNLGLYIEQAQAMADIETEYSRGVALMEENKIAEAQEIFTRLSRAVPNYRDVALRLEQLQKLFDLETRLRAADMAYKQEKWEDAITIYTEIRNIDSTYQPELINRQLYDGYLQAVQTILSQKDKPIEQLLKAQTFFTNAMSIYPQNSQSAGSQEDLRKSVEQALYSAYNESTNQILSAPEGTLANIQMANAMLQNALKIRSDDLSAIKLLETSDHYLLAVESYQSGNWNQSIQEIELVLAENPDFAWGTSYQVLFDSLIEHGRTAYLTNDYELALADFEKAEQTAEKMPENLAASLAAQVEYARVLGEMGRLEEAAKKYQTLIADMDLIALANKRNPKLEKQFTDAQTLVDIGNFQAGYIGYRDAFDEIGSILDTIKYTVQEGDYLSYLAARHHTTADWIMRENQLISRILSKGELLTIPYRTTTPAP